jgi:hypothetical protein
MESMAAKTAAAFRTYEKERARGKIVITIA